MDLPLLNKVALLLEKAKFISTCGLTIKLPSSSTYWRSALLAHVQNSYNGNFTKFISFMDNIAEKIDLSDDVELLQEFIDIGFPSEYIYLSKKNTYNLTELLFIMIMDSLIEEYTNYIGG